MAKKLEQAQTLLFVMFLLIVSGTLAAGLSQMLKSEVLARSSEKDALIAFYLAQAGLERGKVDVFQLHIPYSSGNFTDIPGGNYSYNLSSAGSTDIRNITAIGFVVTSGKVVAQKAVSVQYKGYDSACFGGCSQVPGTWHEE